MKILITGIAGFIGFNLANALAKDKRIKRIIGIDNINNYYSVRLKKKRINLLNKKKIIFYKIDLIDSRKLEEIFKKNKFDVIYHLAAQAGVQYSITNPRKYIDSNILGFFNLLELCKKYNSNKIIYASSSSVYGDSKKFPLKESTITNPKNFYGLTKKNNEEVAQLFSEYYNINLIGLRFFTVFGEWGRPDMFIFKLLKSSFNNKTFYLNNYGNHYRDFTYIKDVIELIKRINFTKEKHKVYNICSNNPINLKNLLIKILKHIPMTKIKKVKFQIGDIIKTHGDNKEIIKNTGFNKFTKIEEAIKNTINWYQINYKNFN
jgi:UDP-glucuronate 4-epimerase